MKKILFALSLIFCFTLVGCSGEPEVDGPIHQGDKSDVNHVQHITGDNYQVEIVSKDGTSEWYSIGGFSQVSVKYVDGLKTSYIERDKDIVSSVNDNIAVYRLYLKKDQVIDGGNVQVGKNSYVKSQMIDGNQK